MAEIRLTPAARNQLMDIWHYSTETWGEEKARDYLMAIDETLRALGENPKLGRRRPEIKQGYHSFPVNRHVVFYMTNGDVVHVIGILHERMDVQRML
jgi:toxin ParE1/3/4